MYKENVDWIQETVSQKGFRLQNLGYLLSMVKEDNLGNVLDLGCGYGDLVYYIDNNLNSYIGIDKDSKAIDTARGRFFHHELSSAIVFMVLDIPHLASEFYSQFDTMFALDIFEHLRCPECVLDNIREGFEGTLYFTTPNKDITGGKNPYHYKEFTLDELTIAIGKVKKIFIRKKGNNFYGRVIYEYNTP